MAVAALTTGCAGCADVKDGTAGDAGLADFEQTMRVADSLVLQIKTSKIINDMAKVQIKSEKITAFGGINIHGDGPFVITAR